MKKSIRVNLSIRYLVLGHDTGVCSTSLPEQIEHHLRQLFAAEGLPRNLIRSRQYQPSIGINIEHLRVHSNDYTLPNSIAKEIYSRLTSSR